MQEMKNNNLPLRSEVYDELKKWMDYRKDAVEEINEKS